MFSWLNFFNIQNCDLNNSMVNWLGVEREGLPTECAGKLEVLLERNSSWREKTPQSLNYNYKSAK